MRFGACQPFPKHRNRCWSPKKTMTSTVFTKRRSRRAPLELILESSEDHTPSSGSSSTAALPTMSTLKAEGMRKDEGSISDKSFVDTIARMLKRGFPDEPSMNAPKLKVSTQTDRPPQTCVAGPRSETGETEVQLPYHRFSTSLSPRIRSLLVSLRFTVSPEDDDMVLSPPFQASLPQVDTDTIRSSPPSRSSSWSSTPSPQDPLGDIVWPGRLSCPASANAAAIPSPLRLGDVFTPSTRNTSSDSLGWSHIGGIPLTPRWVSPTSDKSQWDPKDETNPYSALFFPYTESPRLLSQDSGFGDNGSRPRWENDIEAHEALTMSMCGLSTGSANVEEAVSDTLNPAAEEFRPGSDPRTDGSSIGNGVSLAEFLTPKHMSRTGDSSGLGDGDSFTVQQGQGRRPRYKRVRTRPKGRHG